MADDQTERTRFTFVFRHGLAELLGPDSILSMAGQHIDFRWGDHIADGLVEQIEELDGAYHVTMAVEAPLGLGEEATAQ